MLSILGRSKGGRARVRVYACKTQRVRCCIVALERNSTHVYVRKPLRFVIQKLHVSSFTGACSLLPHETYFKEYTSTLKQKHFGRW